jgi:hypothetical protein
MKAVITTCSADRKFAVMKIGGTHWSVALLLPLC